MYCSETRLIFETPEINLILYHFTTALYDDYYYNISLSLTNGKNIHTEDYLLVLLLLLIDSTGVEEEEYGHIGKN